MNKETGGPAFPLPVADDRDCAGRSESGYVGMTLRDYFAAHCPLPLDDMRPWEAEATARYRYADAMIAARNK